MPQTKGGGAGGTGVTIINNLTSGGTGAALSAQQGVVLKALVDALSAGRLLTGSGVPASGLGTDGDAYMRTDKPFLGGLYLKAAGAWAQADNSYTLAGLPTAAVGNLGAVATVVDSTYCPTGKEFQCVTYDSGTSYYWRPVDGKWMILHKTDSDTADAGTNADVTISSFNISLPNRSDMYPPGMAIHIIFHGIATGVNGAKSWQVKGLSMSGGTTSTLAGMGASAVGTLTARVENMIYVTASNTGTGYRFSAFTSNTSTSAIDTYSGANWANLAITFTKNGVSASDTVKGAMRSIEFIYPS